uniref:Uncharacterized protein n=1 Tax=Salmonella sp. TaxID=599 RepID=A0A482EX88_SALSP|nr:hypothetical protein [Salmonella sp.]QBM91465.1 hypothetical protein NNIBIDOC_00136 [Salmonella sp.]
MRALSELIERNSENLRKQKSAGQNGEGADIESYLNEADKLAEERSIMIPIQVEVARGLTGDAALTEMQKKRCPESHQRRITSKTR